MSESWSRVPKSNELPSNSRPKGKSEFNRNNDSNGDSGLNPINNDFETIFLKLGFPLFASRVNAKDHSKDDTKHDCEFNSKGGPGFNRDND